VDEGVTGGEVGRRAGEVGGGRPIALAANAVTGHAVSAEDGLTASDGFLVGGDRVRRGDLSQVRVELGLEEDDRADAERDGPKAGGLAAQGFLTGLQGEDEADDAHE